jgi:hypothetical protein
LCNRTNSTYRYESTRHRELKRFAKCLILLQSAHFSTLRPTASASQHATPFGLRFSASQLFVSEARPLPTSCWDQSFRELVYSQAARHLGVGEHEIRQRVERSEMRHIKGRGRQPERVAVAADEPFGGKNRCVWCAVPLWPRRERGTSSSILSVGRELRLWRPRSWDASLLGLSWRGSMRSWQPAG